MAFRPTGFPGLILFEPNVITDSRGYFYESYNERLFLNEGIDTKFVQDNQARSSYGVIRGLHFQAEPYAQTKLVRALSGTILDVVVDLRKGSPVYGKVYSVELSAENRLQLLIPKGFAHGYSVLSDEAEVFYKCDRFWNRESENGILYNDELLGIDWKIPEDRRIVSDKDKLYPLFRDSKHTFSFQE